MHFTSLEKYSILSEYCSFSFLNSLFLISSQNPPMSFFLRAEKANFTGSKLCIICLPTSTLCLPPAAPPHPVSCLSVVSRAHLPCSRRPFTHYSSCFSWMVFSLPLSWMKPLTGNYVKSRKRVYDEDKWGPATPTVELKVDTPLIWQKRQSLTHAWLQLPETLSTEVKFCLGSQLIPIG